MPARPTIYSPALGQLICDRLGKGEWLHQIVADTTMPGESTIDRWRDDVPEFAADYARAQRAWHDEFALRGLRAAEQALISETTIIRETRIGEKVVVTREVRKDDNVQRSKLILDATKWFLVRWDPKRYRDPDRRRDDEDRPPGGSAGEDDESGELKITIVNGLPRRHGGDDDA